MALADAGAVEQQHTILPAPPRAVSIPSQSPCAPRRVLEWPPTEIRASRECLQSEAPHPGQRPPRTNAPIGIAAAIHKRALVSGRFLDRPRIPVPFRASTPATPLRPVEPPSWNFNQPAGRSRRGPASPVASERVGRPSADDFTSEGRDEPFERKGDRVPTRSKRSRAGGAWSASTCAAARHGSTLMTS